MKSLVKTTWITLLCLSSFFSTIVTAGSKSDLAKEKRWEIQIVDSLLVGKSIKLKAQGTEFLGLYAEPTTDLAKGAVIIIHGIGAHPAWPDVIDPLRMQLPELGWYTLSLQMPVLKNGATDADYPVVFPEVPARIQAGVDFLKAKGIKNIVLTGHSLGTVMASHYLANNPDPVVKTFAIVSGGPGVKGKPMIDGVANFKKIKNIKIIDIYGGEDNPQVIKTLKKRMQAAEKLSLYRYRTIKVGGANHFYRNKENVLVEALNKQLNNIMCDL